MPYTIINNKHVPQRTPIITNITTNTTQAEPTRSTTMTHQQQHQQNSDYTYMKPRRLNPASPSCRGKRRRAKQARSIDQSTLARLSGRLIDQSTSARAGVNPNFPLTTINYGEGDGPRIAQRGLKKESHAITNISLHAEI